MKFNYDHLWNELPDDERKRLMPHMIEAQIFHYEQCKHKAIKRHKDLMMDYSQHIMNLKRELKRCENK